MFDLLRKGLNLSEKALKLPFRTIRESFGKNNSQVREAAHITEDLIGVPFKMAYRVVDGVQKGRVEAKVDGPTVRNIFVSPEVTVIEDVTLGQDSGNRKAKLKVTGLLCDA